MNIEKMIDKLLSIKFKNLPSIKFKNLPSFMEQHIEIGKDVYGNYIVELNVDSSLVWVAGENDLAGEFGIGKTIEEAIKNYLDKITNKTLVVEIDDEEYEAYVT